MKEIINETKEIVEELCAQYGYDSQDTEKTDSLKTVLLKVIPSMLQGHNYEDRQLFYQMLRHTPIVITENLTKESYKNLVEQYIGKNINQHIVEDDIDLGEYGKTLGAGAYVSEPVFDENMTLQGKKSFIYIQKVTGSAKDFFGTDINVSQLIHELGHAWHAEKDQYVMQADGTLRERIGTAEFTYSFSNIGNNKFLKKHLKTTGLMIEESMNTISEENAMANYMNIPLDQMKSAYREHLVPSNYQSYMSIFTEYMLTKLVESDFKNYRLYGSDEYKSKINKLMEKTDYWNNRNTDILPSSQSPRSYKNKRKLISSIDSDTVQKFFEKYANVYFPDISQMTPLEKIDNVLQQQYNLKVIILNMGIENYTEFLQILGYEGFSLINQSADLLKLQEKKSDQLQTSKITLSSVVKNALQKGTTTEQVQETKEIEKIEASKDNKHTNEGVSINEK